MRKILTLTAAVLTSFSLMAQDPTLPANGTPASTFDALEGDANLYAITNAVHNYKQCFVYDLDTIRVKMKSGDVTWVKGPKDDGGNSVGTISFADGLTDADKYGFNSTWNRAWGINNSRYVGIRVKNCSEFAALTKSNSTKDGKTLLIHVFQKNADAWDFVETIGDGVYNNSKYYVLTATLDAAEEYVVLLTSGNSSNCLTAQIRFASSTLSPSLKAIKIAGVDATVDQDNSKIIAELPYGTVINDALDAIVAADLTYGGSANSFEIASDHSKITVSDGVNSKDYAFELTVNTSVSSDATLKALSLNGVAVTLQDGVYSYDLVLPYAADVNVVAEANDAAAKDVAVDKTTPGVVTITVTAQNDGTQDYTVNYSFLPAKKDLLSVKFENEIKGFITDGKIRVPHLQGSAEPAFVSAEFNGADGTPTAVVEGGNLKVTGIDGQDSLYTIEYAEVAPASVSFNTEITFDSTETYFFSVYGWDSGKGWKFSKSKEEASNKRVSEGKILLYIALPAADSVKLVSGSAGNRAVKIYVNGTLSSVNKTAASNSSIKLELNNAAQNFILVESNQGDGDGGFKKMTVFSAATAIDNTEAGVKAVKVIRNGQLFIEKNGVLYNAQGAIVR